MCGGGYYQSSDLADTNYAAVATDKGCHGIRVRVTRNPSGMLPAVDIGTAQVKNGDWVA